MARHAEAMERVSRAILETPGDLDPAVRRAAEAHAADLVASGGGRTGLPEELVTYVEKVAQHAYKVVDADIDGLRDAGYSEDAIFELTLATALGAARARLERGLAATRTEH
jgi:alkylhydroperoxidase family enzyme